MKLRNEFLLHLFGWSAIVGLIALTGCDNTPETADKTPPNISVVESGLIDGYYYHVFYDKQTQRRIFEYRGGPVLLPPDSPEKK